MQSELIGTSIEQFGTIRDGECFIYFNYEGQPQLALKARLAESGAVVLANEDDPTKCARYIKYDDIKQDLPILFVPTAKLVPSIHLSDVSLPPVGENPKPGRVYLFGDVVALCFWCEEKHRCLLLNVSSGTIVETPETRMIEIARWSLSIERFGKAVNLFTFPRSEKTGTAPEQS